MTRSDASRRVARRGDHPAADMADDTRRSSPGQPITEKLCGSMDKSNEAMVKRSSIRTILGNEVIRELVIK
jgi:hypothetical protein